MTTHLPRIGAAMPISALAEYKDWLMDGQRDLEIQDPVVPDVLDGNWQKTVKDAKSILDGFTGRLGIHGPFRGLTIMAHDPKVRDLTHSRLMQGLEMAEALGATHIVVHSPFEFFGASFLPHSQGFGQEAQLELIHKTIGGVVKQAEQIGCTIVLEDIFDLHPAPIQTVVRSFESEYVKRSIDTGHAYITHLRGGPPPDQWVREDGALLEHVHIQDTDGQYDRHWRPGVGHINWFAFFEAIATLEHQPRLILELRNKDEIRQSAEWFQKQGLAQ